MQHNMKEVLKSLRDQLESIEQETRPQQSAQHASSQASQANAIQVGLSANDAVRGMMWAEVFGPPRSKRPFRWSHRY